MKKINYTKLLFDYGTLVVLTMLCGWFSYVTIEEQSPTNSAAAERLAKRAGDALPKNANVIVLARQGGEGELFTKILTVTRNRVKYELLTPSIHRDRAISFESLFFPKIMHFGDPVSENRCI